MVQKTQTDYHEEGIEVPYENITPDTLRNLVEEFVTREWSDLSDSGYSLVKNLFNLVIQRIS